MGSATIWAALLGAVTMLSLSSRVQSLSLVAVWCVCVVCLKIYSRWCNGRLSVSRSLFFLVLCGSLVFRGPFGGTC